MICAYIHFTHGEGIDDLSQFVNITRSQSSLLLIGADANGHSRWWGPPSQISNATGKCMEDFIVANDLAVHNTWPSPPTFISEHGFQSWIDVTLSSQRLSDFISSWRVLEDAPLHSDHQAISFKISLTTPKVEMTRLDWQSVDWDSFKILLRDILNSDMPSPSCLRCASDIDRFSALLNDAFQQTIATQVPVKRIYPKSNPWWSPELDELRHTLTRLRRQWKRSHSREDKKAVNATKRSLRMAIEVAKRESWRHFCETTDQKTMWTNFKKITRDHAQRVPHDLIFDGQNLSDDKDKAHIFANHFFPSQMKPNDDFHNNVEIELDSFLSGSSLAPSIPIMSHELHSALHSSGPWKAPGHDRVPLAMLRKCEDILTPYLLPLYSASLRLHHIPPTWKVANVIAVPKANGDLSSVTGYRPISLLCCVAKVLETIITARLTFHMESKGLLTSTQYGFRKRHNTEQALWQLISDASTNLQVGKRTVTLSLEIQSAYDRVWHPGLLQKLADFDIQPDLLGWIASFLENRAAHTLVGSAEVVRPLLMGVPQGSPLSPILFLICIQDLLDRLTGVPGAKVQAFADDIIAWWTLNRGCFGTAIASDLRRILEDWETKWKMEFSPPKCKLLVIGRTHDPPPSFFLKGVALPRVMCLRYLGIWIDARLTWCNHIRLVA